MNHDRTFNGGVVISTAQKKFGNSSWLFDGSNDYVSMPAHTDFDFGTGDFTIAFWIRTAQSGTNVALMSYRDSVANGNWGIFADLNGSPNLNFYYYNGSHINVTTGVAVNDNVWHHITVARSSGTLKIFIDGVQQASQSVAVALGTASAVLRIGCDSLIPSYFNGYIDEIHISKGIARWTSAFVTPDQPYVADPSTVLLCHCEGDMLGTGAHDITTVGTPVMGTAVPNSNYGGSLQLNGSSYLSLANSADFDFGTGDFTVDFWAYFVDSTAYQVFVYGSDTGSFFLDINGIAGKLSIARHNIAYDVSLTHGISSATWAHIAFVRYNSNVYIFVNGTMLSGSPVSNSQNYVTGTVNIGSASGTQNLNGNLAGLRISKGLARWTSNFTPPSSPYSKPIGGVDGYTKLMLHMDGGNNSAVFTDSSLTPKTVSVTGVVQKNDKMMFGRSCAYFDGSSYLSLASSSDWDIGSGNFTVDFWLYPTTEARQAIFAFQADYRYGIDFHRQGTRNINIWASNNGSSWNMLNADSPGANGVGYISLPLNAWSHVVILRDGNNWRSYINGVKDIDVTVSGTVFTPPDNMNIARWGGDALSKFTGYIDEYRFSKGVARYSSANFTPPTKPYDTPAVDGYTKLLLHMNGTNGSTQFPDAGSFGYSASAGGTSQVSTAAYKFNGSSASFDGSGYISLTPVSMFNFGSGEFTIDFWAKPGRLSPDLDTLFTLDRATGHAIANYGLDSWIDSSGRVSVYFSNGSSQWGVTGSNNLVGSWHHIAFVRSVNTLSLYVDGVSVGTPQTISGSITFDGSTLATLGGRYGQANTPYLGNMQEFRVSNVARWTANFAPPVRPYGS